MTTLEGVATLFSQLQLPDRGLDWLAEQLLAAALSQRIVLLENVPVGDGEAVLYVLSRHSFPVEQADTGLFRSLLAGLIGTGRRESGKRLNPYGDRFTLRRGDVDLHLDIANTPALQRLQITRISPAA